MKKKILIITSNTFSNRPLVMKELETLGYENYEFYRLNLKFNMNLFSLLNIITDNCSMYKEANLKKYDGVLAFKDFGFDDINMGINYLSDKFPEIPIRVVEDWDHSDTSLYQNKETTTGMGATEIIKYWSDVQSLDDSYLQGRMCSAGSSEPYIKKVIGNLEIDLKGDLPGVRIEMAKQSTYLFYAFRYLFPKAFSKTVWYGFMCHNGIVYCLFGTLGKYNQVEVTRVTFYPGTKPTTSAMFSAVLKTMNPGTHNLPEYQRAYIIQKYSSFDHYMADPDNKYLLSQDGFVGLNIQSGNMFLATLDQEGKIKMEGV